MVVYLSFYYMALNYPEGEPAKEEEKGDRNLLACIIIVSKKNQPVSLPSVLLFYEREKLFMWQTTLSLFEGRILKILSATGLQLNNTAYHIVLILAYV